MHNETSRPTAEHENHSSSAENETGSYWPNRNNGSHENLASPEELAATMEIFHRDRLIVRAMDEPTRDRDGAYDHDIWDSEIELMASEYGIRSASCTLLVPGEAVSTYKAYGMMLDADILEPLHIHPNDSGSNGDFNDADHFARWSRSTPGLQDYDELAALIRATHAKDMNEINANIPLHALRGIFASESRGGIPLLNALVTQRHLARRFNINAPIFTYKRETGDLHYSDMSKTEIEALIDGYKNNATGRFADQARERYRAAIFSD